MVETVGHGAAVLDMDGDGDLDLFVPDGTLAADRRLTGTWRLYRNDGGMRFTDVTAGSGLDADSWGSGAVAGDADGDGRPDLFVPCFGKDHLFRNSAAAGSRTRRRARASPGPTRSEAPRPRWAISTATATSTSTSRTTRTCAATWSRRRAGATARGGRCPSRAARRRSRRSRIVCS